MNPVITFPLFVSPKKEVAEQRREFYKSYVNLKDLPIPVVCLGMNLTDEDRDYLNSCNIIVCESAPVTASPARLLLNMFVMNAGYDWTLWVDDDFVYKPEVVKELPSFLSVESRMWLWHRARYSCTAFSKKDVVFDFCVKNSPETVIGGQPLIRSIPKGSDLDKCSDVGMFWTRDGIFSKVTDYMSAIAWARQKFGIDEYDERFSVTGEDVLTLMYLAHNYGVNIFKIGFMKHHTCLDATPGQNYSTFYKQDDGVSLMGDMFKEKRTKNHHKSSQIVANIADVYLDFLDGNQKQFKRLCSLNQGRSL